MKWFALLGREKAVVRAELASLVSPGGIDFSGAVALSSEPIPNWNQMGGVIRAGKIICTATTKELLIHSLVPALPTPHKTGKVSIGLSSYAMTPRDLRIFGKMLKESYALAHTKRPRIVFPKTGPVLNAGHISGSNLLSAPNCEIFVIQQSNTWLAGITHWQQDIESYTKRDRERPARDARVGMLPPKLAQIMLNLAGVSNRSHVHDPFCGTGVILTEALLKHAHISGSDAAPEMVQASKENVDWMFAQSGLVQQTNEIFQADAQTVLIPDATTHIVSEGYLGNPNLRDTTSKRLQEEAQQLQPLYHNFFRNIAGFPHPLTIVFALPVWFSPNSPEPIRLQILDDLPDMGYTVEQFAPDSATMLIYRRTHQTVGRAIIKLKKG